jgi:hypothetical protein
VCISIDRVAIAEDRRQQTTAADNPAFGYFHRWSKNDQYEFTPTGQDDLEKWSDMITINLYPSAHHGDGLAVKANAVLENYKSHGGRVLRTNSVPPACGALHRSYFWPAKFYRSGICAVQISRRRWLLGRLFASHLRRENRRPNE